MTAPTITSSSKGNLASASSHSIPIPSGSTGELLVMLLFGNNGTSVASSTGWTSVHSGNRWQLLKKTASTASEADNTVTWSGGSIKIAYYVIRSNAQDVAAADTGTTGYDPPSLTPSWGSAANKWLSGFFCSNDDWNSTALPSGYTALDSQPARGTTGDIRFEMAYKDATGASDDPGVWTVTGTDTGRRSITIALREAAATNPTIDSTTKLESGQSFVITGSTFGASAGTNGRVRLSTTNSSAAGTDQTGLTWGDLSITVASANVGGAADGTTLYLFVRNDSSLENASGFAVPVADMVLRVGSGVLTDTLKDTDAGTDIGSEACARMIVISGAAGSEVIAQSYTDAVITSGVLEYDDSALYNVSTEGDTFQVAIQGNSATRLGFLPAIVVDRNDD